jgi:hypothetical protein
MASIGLFYQPQVTPPPWGWNPGQTFLTAYYEAQDNQRAKQKAALDMELAQILLPAKKAEADYNMKKLSYDSQLLEKIYQTKSAALDESYRGVTSAVGGSNSNVPGSQSSGTVAAGGFQSRFGFGSKLTSTANAPQSAPTTRKVGSGLMPKTR